MAALEQPIVTSAATFTFQDFLRMVRAMPPAARNLLAAALDAVADEEEAPGPAGGVPDPDFMPGMRCGVRCEVCHRAFCNRGDPGHTHHNCKPCRRAQRAARGRY